MSFYDDASLVFLPSGEAGKDGKAYSMKPTNGDGDFTFSRGSNLTATRVDSNGLIEKGRENLFKQSNNFDTTPWTGLTPTSGQTGYDGSNDAWLLTKTSSGAQSVYNYINETGVMTMSVYAKAGSTNWMRLTQGGKTAYFDLSGSGAVGTSSNGIDQTITSVGNGWFRCTLTANKTTAGQTPIYPYTAEGDASGSTDSIYIQDAQFEQGLVATEYIESGATTGLAGILEDSPRFDYSGGASCPSLLLEPSRSNLIPSEYLPLMSIIGSPVITPNATTSPEGYQNMAEFSSSATSDRYQKNLGVLSGQHTFSAFFKYSGTDKSVYLRMSDTSSRLKVDIASSGVTIDSGGSLNIDDSDVIDYGNGIYRAYMIFTPSTGTTFAQFYPSATDTSGSIYGYGFQMEQGSYPTSYIPNHSGGSVTRNADGQTLDITNLISSTEGTLFFHLKDAKSHSQTNKILGIGDGSGVDNFFGLYVNDFQTGAVGIRNRQANADLMNTAIPNPQNAKVAIKFSRSGVKTFLNGSEFQSSATAYTGWATSFDLNTSVGDVDLKQYFLFPTALSDAECITLTS